MCKKSKSFIFKNSLKSIQDQGVCWITCCSCLFLLIAIWAEALDNMKQQKGYCAVTRTTHICSGTEKKWTQNRTTRQEREKTAPERDEGQGSKGMRERRRCRGNKRGGEKAGDAEKIERNKEWWRETEKGGDRGRRGDSTIYGRLVVMVISRRRGRDEVVKVMALH